MPSTRSAPRSKSASTPSQSRKIWPRIRSGGTPAKGAGSGRPAGGAEAARLDGDRAYVVAGHIGRGELGADVGLELGRRAAAVADQERGGVAAFDAAGDIGVQAFDAVGESDPLEELQSAIDGRRLRRRARVVGGNQV